jgi:3-(3-hydroxy-phenyl)propionate hydroxylase
VFVCDRSRAVYAKPRAMALDHEIMRIFQQLGVADRVAPWTAPFGTSAHHGADGQVIRRVDMVPPPYPQGWTPNLVFSQPPVETALRAHAASLPSIELALGSELVRLAPHDDHVALDLTDDAGVARRIAARWVIGCDGASSTVRTLAGLALDDLGFDEPWLVVDVLVNDRGMAKLPTVSQQICEPERPCTLVIGPGNHRRWEISLKPGEDPATVVEPEETWRLLARWITPDDGELWRQAAYRFHALVARDWRVGRVLIAGDAAHQQPPFIGQGMCQGIRDVVNLAWKLEAVLRGRAAPRLLDSYGVERGAHVRRLTGRLKEIGAVICERDPAAARRRDAALLAEGGGQARTITRQEIVPPLEVGLLSAAASTARGTLFPQPWLATPDGPARFDDRVGHGWRLVLDAGIAPPAETPFPLRLAPMGSLRETEGVLAAWFARHACRAALVRPDHYVFGTATRADEIRSLIDEADRMLH